MSYIKILAVIFSIAIGAMLGISKGNTIKRQYQELLYLKKTSILIRGEIRYNCGVAGEVFFNVSKRVKEPYKSAFISLSEDLENHRGEDFSHMWNKNVIEPLKELALSSQDTERFKELGENIGYLDMQMQLNYIDFYIEKLDARIDEIKTGIEGNVKLYRTLGIMGGLLAAIFII